MTPCFLSSLLMSLAKNISINVFYCSPQHIAQVQSVPLLHLHAWVHSTRSISCKSVSLKRICHVPGHHVVKCLHRHRWREKVLSKEQGWGSAPLHLHPAVHKEAAALCIANNIQQKSPGQPLPPSPAGGETGQAWGSPRVLPSHTSFQSQRHTKVLDI